jgi:hypothetical protein
MAVVNADGPTPTVKEATWYHPYGTMETLHEQTIPVRTKFTGKEFDESGNVYATAEFDLKITNFQLRRADNARGVYVRVRYEDPVNHTGFEVFYDPTVDSERKELRLSKVENVPVNMKITRIVISGDCINLIGDPAPVYNYVSCNYDVITGKITTIRYAGGSIEASVLQNSSNFYKDHFSPPTPVTNATPIAGSRLFYFGKRYYDAEIGRWVAVDPEGQFDDAYSYAGNGCNPISATDADGGYMQLYYAAQTGLTYASYYAGVYGPRVAMWASSAWQRFGRFFYDSRPFAQISREYWARMGGANGASLHHWLLPQRWNLPVGIQNAGFNLLNLPSFQGVFHPTLGLNQWMGFASRWGGFHAQAAAFVENSIRIGIPASLATGGYIGSQVGLSLADGGSTGGLSNLRLEMNIDMDKLTNFDE